MLVTPQATKRTLSSVSFDSMVIKAARSAENVNSTTVQVSNGLKGHHDNSIIRKESSSSLQIPGLLRRTNSDSAKSDDQNSKKVGSQTLYYLLLQPVQLSPIPITTTREYRLEIENHFAQVFVISSEDDFLGQVFGSQQRGKVRTKKAGCLHYYLSDYSKKQYFKMTLVNTASLLFYLQYTSMYFNVHFVQQHQDNCILYTHTLLSILILLCCISILTLFYTGCPSNFRPRFQS